MLQFHGLEIQEFFYVVMSLNISIKTDVTFLSAFYSFQWGLMQYILRQQIYLKWFEICQTDMIKCGIIKQILYNKILTGF